MKKKTQKRKNILLDAAPELCNNLLEIYLDSNITGIQ